MKREIFKNSDGALNARINLYYAVITTNGRIFRLFPHAGDPCRACRSSVYGNFHFLELFLCGSLDPTRNWKDRDGPRMANAHLIWLILTILQSRNVFVLWRSPFFFTQTSQFFTFAMKVYYFCVYVWAFCVFFTCAFPCFSG